MGGEEKRSDGGSTDPTAKPDLRYTADESHNVRIERKLDGSGHLARGDQTRMSVLNFSSRHPARTERDPEFEFRPPPAPPPPVEPKAAAPEPPASAPPPVPPEEGASLFGRVKKMFGL